MFEENDVYTTTSKMITVGCYKCGVLFGMPDELDNKFRQTHEMFCCPFGHQQHYLGETREEALKRQLQQSEARCSHTEDQLESTQNSLRSTRGVVTRIKNRVKRGVCPFCNRHFENVERHMKAKHSDD